MTPTFTRGLAALLAASAFTLTLAGPMATSTVAQVHTPPGGPVLTSHLPDLIPTTLGYVLVSGFVKWGQTGVLEPHQAEATQVGPQRDLCRIRPVAYRTHNKGDGDATAFVTKTFVGNTLAHTHNVPGGLKSKQSIDWHQYSLDLKEGMNVIKVVYDANKQVAETDESNSFIIKANVKIDCDGDGRIGGIAVPGGGLKQAPGKPDPDPRPTRGLQLKPAN